MKHRKDAIAHRAKAIDLLAQADDSAGMVRQTLIAQAQVHATLAVACATMDAADVARVQ